MKVFLHPNPKPLEEAGSGIDVVVYKMHQLLKERKELELVRTWQEADIVAVHICPPGDRMPVDVLHCHGLYPTGEMEMPNWAWELNKRVIDAALVSRVMTVPAPWVGELFMRDMGIVPTVVPHGLTMSEWPVREVSGPVPVVLWNKNRTQDVCDPKPLQALAAAAPDVKFVSTFGEKAGNVTVTGTMPFPKMKELLYQCGVYLATTKETFGIGILEALATGLPVLGWNWGSLPDIVEHKVTGYVAHVGDIEDTKRGLYYILENYVALSKAARARAEQYDWSKAIDKYVAVYEEAWAHKQDEQKGKVSIVIPCYNYEKYVAGAIQSVQKQDDANWECIVVDDGSKDKSLAVIKNAVGEDTRFRVIAKPNGGVASARNTGAAAATGHYLMFLDADDYVHPQAVHRLRNELRQDRTLGIVYGGIRVVDSNDKLVAEKSSWPGPFNVGQQLDKKNQVPSCCLMRRDRFLRTGGLRQHAAPTEDAELWTRFVLNGSGVRMINHKQPVYTYRVHNKSASTRYRDGQKPEPDWLGWMPFRFGGHIPFASLQKPGKLSHPVPNYDDPLVSFVIPVGERHKDLLVDALESVTGQVEHHWEIIVVDDTVDGKLADYGPLPYRVRYPYVNWLVNPKHKNVSSARNFGVQHSKGKYLTFLDADDFLYRDYLTKTLQIIKQCEDDSVLVYTDWMSLPNNEPHTAENWNIQRLMDHALFAVTFLLPRTAFDTVGGFDENLDLWEDWDFTIKLALQGYRGIRVPGALFAYRYDTGERREQSLDAKERLLRQIRAKYASETPRPRRH